jgi:hypothetical protein
MSITVVKYYCSNPASVPLKQYSDVRYTTTKSGMPAKFAYADGGSTFSTGRKVYIDAPQCSSIINGTTPYSSIRVDNYNLTDQSTPCSTVISNPNWSTKTQITIPGQRRSALYTSPRCCGVGKMTVVSSSDEYIERKKNRAIGRGISSSSGFLTFADNDLQGHHTNYLSVANAKRRCRNSGYVVPPKCRGNGKYAGCGKVGGGPVTALL